MKKILYITIFILIIIALPTFADDDVSGGGGIEGALKYTQGVENAFAGQKQITDEQFQKTLSEVKARQNKKKKKNKPLKGSNVNNENSGEYINETAEKNILLMLPVTLTNTDGTEIPIGHYKIIGEKNGKNVYLDFYQSYTLVAKVPAIETNSDFDEPAINFVKILPYNKKKVKVIFGSMDFNAYTFIPIKNEISDQN